eukprot:GHVU01052460.1.p1 GENE.GHVU01052460.1~~GHVU01052460.1.p1  ORF type:complete len:217 (+),score=11.17 GHVU01052460.1:97-747(+)
MGGTGGVRRSLLSSETAANTTAPPSGGATTSSVARTRGGDGAPAAISNRSAAGTPRRSRGNATASATEQGLPTSAGRPPLSLSQVTHNTPAPPSEQATTSSVARTRGGDGVLAPASGRSVVETPRRSRGNATASATEQGLPTSAGRPPLSLSQVTHNTPAPPSEQATTSSVARTRGGDGVLAPASGRSVVETPRRSRGNATASTTEENLQRERNWR